MANTFWAQPTKKAYKLQGHTEVQGIPIAIENRKGSVRKGVDSDGNKWRTKMHYPYGYIKGTKGADNEEIDAYVGPDKSAPRAYVVHQHNDTGKGYDEDKVMLGFRRKTDARKAFLAHYDSPKFLGPISTVPVTRLKEMVDSDKKLTKISAVSPWTYLAGPAAVGGLVGGGVGALGDKENRLRGAGIGALTGAGIGAGVGHLSADANRYARAVEDVLGSGDIKVPLSKFLKLPEEQRVKVHQAASKLIKDEARPIYKTAAYGDTQPLYLDQDVGDVDYESKEPLKDKRVPVRPAPIPTADEEAMGEKPDDGRDDTMLNTGPSIASDLGADAFSNNEKSAGAVFPKGVQAAFVDELHKLGALTAQEARESLARLEELEEAPTLKQIGAYTALGAGSGPVIGGIQRMVRGPGINPFSRSATSPAHPARQLASEAAGGALFSGALPLVRGEYDKWQETSKLRSFLEGNESAYLTPTGRLKRGLSRRKIRDAKLLKNLKERFPEMDE